MTDSLRTKGKSGMLWSFMIQGGTQVVNFIVSILLARILLPEQFGLIGMIVVFIAVGRALVSGGFGASLIRTKGVDNIDYSTVFFINFLSALVLYGILFFGAPSIASFYEEPILTGLVRVYGLVLIVNAFSMVQSTKLNKELKFKTQFKLQLPALIISGGLALWMAYAGYGVWSLIYKDLGFAILATIQLWWYAKWVPSFVIDRNKLRYHFNFGYKITLTTIMDTGFKNLYQVVIGKYFSAAQLGFYTRAQSLQQRPSGFFFNAFKRVFYPLLSTINDEDERLKRVYSKLMMVAVFVVTPIMVFMGIVAEPMFRWLLTAKWLPAVPYFQILVVVGILYPLHQYNLNICKIKGRSDMVLKLIFLQNVLLLLGGFSAIWFGIYGLLWSLVAVNLMVTLVNAHYSGKLINLGLKEQLLDLVPIFALNSIIGMVFYFIQSVWASQLPDFLNLIIVGMGFLSIYGGAAYLFKMSVIKDLITVVRKKNV